MGISFKPAVSEDIFTILKFIKNFHGMSSYPFHEEKVGESVRNLIKNNNLGRIWIIEFDSKSVGYIILTFGYSIEYKGRDAFIDELYIEEEFRSRGIGRETMDFVIKESVKLGIKAVHLEVERNNDAAKNLYEKYDFKDNGRTLMTRWIGE
ncbi:MAG: GNAT family N-acetyltransferase [Ignavibacteria bacterium]